MSATLPKQTVRWHPLSGADSLVDEALARVLDAAGRALDARGQFVIVLAGGNTPRALYERLRDAATAWPAWHVWYGDERCAPADDAERNSRMAQLAWLDHVAIPALQIHPIAGELGPVEGARRYAAELADAGTFDLVLLGLGEDGHTASLFPGQDLGDDATSAPALPVFDAPKPPPERISLSAYRLSDTRETLFLVGGEGKRDAVRRWRGGEAIPARAIAPAGGVDVLVEAQLLG